VVLLLLQPFNGLFSRTAWANWHQKGRTILDFNEAGGDRWQWHQLDHMQIICTSLQRDNHTIILPLGIYGPDALRPMSVEAKAISGTFGHWSSMPMVAFDRQDMTSY